jgi:hypothetical protein
MFSTTLAFYYYYYATMLHLVFWGLSLAPSLRPSPMLSLAVSLERVMMVLVLSFEPAACCFWGPPLYISCILFRRIPNTEYGTHSLERCTQYWYVLLRSTRHRQQIARLPFSDALARWSSALAAASLSPSLSPLFRLGHHSSPRLDTFGISGYEPCTR